MAASIPWGPLRGMKEAISDAFNDFGGLVLTRLRRDAPPAPFGTSPPAEATEFQVESTYGFPSSGRIAINGEVVPYTSRTPTLLQGLTRDDAIRVTYPRGDVLALWTRDVSTLDLARRAMLVEYAEGDFLDVVGQNYGVPRYLDAADTLYRRIIKALAYQAAKGSRTAINEFLTLVLDGRGLTVTDGEIVGLNKRLISTSAPFTPGMKGLRVRLAGTGNNSRICKIVEVLDASSVQLERVGSPWWQAAQPLTSETGVTFEVLPFNIVETPWKPCTVIIELTVAPPEDATGFAYLQGGEVAQTSIDGTTVETSADIRQVLGVWLTSDPYRHGTNYATDNNFSGRTITLSTPVPPVFGGGGPAQRAVFIDYGSVNAPAGAPATGLPGDARGPGTAQLLQSVNIRNPGNEAEVTDAAAADPPVIYASEPPIIRYPLYLGDRVGALRGLLDLITVAGVIPELDVRTW